jgi:hypothetical protein
MDLVGAAHGPAHPCFLTKSSPYPSAAQLLRRHHVAHWRDVRRHHRRLHALRLARFRTRLHLLAARSLAARGAPDARAGEAVGAA